MENIAEIVKELIVLQKWIIFCKSKNTTYPLLHYIILHTILIT